VDEPVTDCYLESCAEVETIFDMLFSLQESHAGSHLDVPLSDTSTDVKDLAMACLLRRLKSIYQNVLRYDSSLPTLFS
jgi:hypothetical protein